MPLLDDFPLQYTFSEDFSPVAAIIVAAGNSSRMGQNKQFISLLGIPVIARTLLAFETCAKVRDIVVVTREDCIADLERICDEYNITKLTAIVKGGETRQESVENGIKATSLDISYYAIHDGARPLVTPHDISECIEDARVHGAAALGVFVKDTIKRVNIEKRILETPNREYLMAVQTPQIFEADIYKKALAKAKEDELAVTDDCAIVENAGYGVFIHQGSYENIKVTTPEDVTIAEAILKGREFND